MKFLTSTLAEKNTLTKGNAETTAIFIRELYSWSVAHLATCRFRCDAIHCSVSWTLLRCFFAEKLGLWNACRVSNDSWLKKLEQMLCMLLHCSLRH